MSVARLVIPTIKVRRLGYFVILTRILREFRSLPENSLIREFEKRSLDSKKFFENYPYKSRKETPVTPTKKHNASKRYIQTSRELGLIAKLANEWHITKLGDVLASLPKEENPFMLSLSQRCFLLKLLLKKDITLRPIIKIIITKTLDISEKLEYYKEYLDKKGITTGMKKNPEKYFYEHIEKPKIEWLKDLGVITLKGELNEKFSTFFSEELFQKDPNLEDIYYQEFSKVNEKLRNAERFDDLSRERKRELLKDYLNKCYNLFGLPGWRISANQFFEYTICVMLCEDKILSSFPLLEKSFVDLFDYSSFPFKLRKLSGEDIGFIIKV